MLKFNERAANTVQNPESPDKVLFLNPDGVLQLKDSAGTLTNLVAENATGQSTARPFKVYKALLTQIGTSAPVAIVLENTLSDDIELSYSDVGAYFVESAGGVFTNNKTIVIVGTATDETPSSELKVNAYRGDNNTIILGTVDLSSSTAINGVLLNTTLIIEVYP